MKHIYAVESSGMLDRYQAILDRFRPQIQSYLVFLRENFAVRSLPRCVIWTDRETATQLISDIPIPAYTNDYRTVFCPEMQVWQEVYLRQLEEEDDPQVRRYYESELTEAHILQILGHEFVHHSDFFHDDTYEKARWFEEGMCEYISRKYFLSGEAFFKSAQINSVLVEHYERIHPRQPMAAFAASTYSHTYADIFYAYWRSFLLVKALVDDASGDVMAVFRKYWEWCSLGCPDSLQNWFEKEK